MVLTLLPGHGVALPWAGRSLRFGMTLAEVRGSVEPYADLGDTFVCGAGWARKFALDGVRVCVFADRPDGLAGVSASRTPDGAATAVPVGLDDIDLFGWPAAEVIDALRDTGRDVRATRTSAWVDGDLHLEWPAPPAFINHLCLYAPSPRDARGVTSGGRVSA
jgi:hypothetical protein